MTKTIIITNHGYERLRERAGYNRQASERMASKAYDDGICIEDINGRLEKLLEYKKECYNSVNTYKIYGNYLYIFSLPTELDEIFLITVYELPNKYKKSVNIAKKKKENRTKYRIEQEEEFSA